MQPASHASLIRRIAGWLMLALYLGSLPGALPLVFSAVADASGAHEVTISAAHGDWDVILSHEDAGEHGHDHGPDHGVVSEEDDHHHGPDHVFCFSASSSEALAASSLSAQKLVLHAVAAEKCSTPEFRIYPVPVYLDSVAARPPPGKPAWLVCLRTTVLIV